jgi:hypothetical protein
MHSPRLGDQQSMITDLSQMIQRGSAAGPRRVAPVLPSSVESLHSAAMAHKHGLAQCGSGRTV